MTRKEYLERKHISAAALARECGVDRGTMSRVANGTHWPRKELALKIDQLTGYRINWNQMLRAPSGEQE